MAIILTTPINQLHPVQVFFPRGSFPPLLVIDRTFPILKVFQNVQEHVLLKFRQAIDADVFGFVEGINLSFANIECDRRISLLSRYVTLINNK